MKLKTYIFRWVLFATLIPVAALGLFSTYYMETIHTESLHHEGRQVLEQITLDLSAGFKADSEQLIHIADNVTMRNFLPVLQDSSADEIHPAYAILKQQVAYFFIQVQSLFKHFNTIRVLDIQGNTVIKVINGRAVQASYENLNPYHIVEPENFNKEELKQFSQLADTQISLMNYALHTQELSANKRNIPMLEVVVPLYHQETLMGFLSVDISNRYENLLSSATVFPGQLLIAQIDTHHPELNGYILYIDGNPKNERENPFQTNIQFLQKLDQGILWNAVNQQSQGYLKSSQYPGHYHFVEFFPNPDNLSSWVIASYSDDDILYGPFQKIRTGLWILLGVAILSALFLAGSAARYISNPIKKLSKNFHIYAEGKKPEKTFSSLDEIKNLAIAFDQMAEILDHAKWDRHHAEQRMIHSAKMASIGQMAAGIGHELNNPLNNMLSLSKLIKREIQGARELTQQRKDISQCTELIKHHQLIQQDLESIQEEIERASNIIRGILNFARQLPDSRVGIFEVKTLVSSCVELVMREAKQKQVQFNITATDTTPQYTSGDFIKLQQALINILQNAVFVSSENQAIDIKMNYTYEYAQLLIRDYGPGFDEDIAEKLFDPFFTTKEIGQGTGLGLSIALGIIESHGGQLNIKNVKNDKGALVTIYLPLVEPE